MKVAGIIAEYNPFHNGHHYLIEQARKNADYVIAVMSGNFTQRGEAAIFDKFHRTHWALLCGADLVIELPVVAATASAADFADAGVAHLNTTGVVDHLIFGSETPDLSQLSAVSTHLSVESADFKRILKSGLKSGLSYPSARSAALKPLISAGDELLNKPNNILAIEYLRALRRQRSSIQPCPILRIGAGYHDTSMATHYCSASALRQSIFEQRDPLLLHGRIPQAIQADMAAQLAEATSNQDFSAQLIYKLLNEKDLTQYADVSEDLANRIANTLNDYVNFSDFALRLKHRHYTQTRIQRVLIHILLNIRRQHTQALKAVNGCGYLRVLGFKDSALPLLKAIKANGNVPLISKPAQALSHLDASSALLYQADTFAADLYRFARNQKCGRPTLHEFCQPLRLEP